MGFLAPPATAVWPPVAGDEEVEEVDDDVDVAAPDATAEWEYLLSVSAAATAPLSQEPSTEDIDTPRAAID